MNSYAVQYVYTPDSAEARKAGLDDHKAFLTTLKEKGALLESGAIGPGKGALIIVRAESLEEAQELMSTEPFLVAGIPASVSIEQWTANWGVVAAAR